MHSVTSSHSGPVQQNMHPGPIQTVWNRLVMVSKVNGQSSDFKTMINRHQDSVSIKRLQLK